MININMMYFKSGNLVKDFTVIPYTQDVSKKTGRPINKYDENLSFDIRGVLANQYQSKAEARKGNSDYVVTHTLVQRGHPKAKRGDMIRTKDRKFNIIDIDATGDYGLCTIYYLEERSDL